MSSRWGIVDYRGASRGALLATALTAASSCSHAPATSSDATDGGHEPPEDALITTIDGAASDCNWSTQDACVATFVEAMLRDDSCEFSLEGIVWSSERHPSLINLQTRLGADNPKHLFRLDSCTSGPGWSFDDVIAPKNIVICPESCAEVRATGAKIEWAFG